MIGMDALDSLICLGFVIKRNTGDVIPKNCGSFILTSTVVYPVDSVELEAVTSLFKEIGQQPEYHNKQLQQRGIELGI